jgi:uncharacterized protein YdaU (DUF1376 family)
MPDPRLPWFPFYWQDFLGSDKVQAMTNEEVGLYLKLLLRQWDKGSIPVEIKHLRAIPNLKSNDDQTLLKLVSLCFTKRNGCYFNLKLARIKQERLKHLQRLSEAGSKGGKISHASSQAVPEAQAKLKPGLSKKILDSEGIEHSDSSPPLRAKPKYTPEEIAAEEARLAEYDSKRAAKTFGVSPSQSPKTREEGFGNFDLPPHLSH